MRDVLAASQSEVLSRFAWSNVLIGLDYDGTLAPIVSRPDDARMRASTRERLVALSLRYPVVVISGRARADVEARLDGVSVRAVVGNHGLEPGGDTERCRGLVSTWLPSLHVALASQQGVEVEDKTYSIAIHYRRSRARRAALDAITRAIDALTGGRRVIGGKLVVNVLPDPAPHKGMALLRLRQELGADTALYVGDDVTDEDVFALDDPGRLLGIRVGRDARSHAPYFLGSQRAMDELLDRLIALRPTPEHRRRERKAS